jgi:streptomycin 6-kinase
MSDTFDEYLTRWGLLPDGEPIMTFSSRLLPVRCALNGAGAMLKIAVEDEEKSGGLLMPWWNGDGAAEVLAHDGDALLLERAEGTKSLADMARSGPVGDDEATRILCRAVARLHVPRTVPTPTLVPLSEWFRDLEPAAATHGGVLALCASTARELLATPQEEVVLHGDIHHGNVLDFGERGWLAIDPKGLSGERGFDYANLFCNPGPETTSVPGRLARQAAIVSAEAGLERRRLLQWIIAWSGLSASWRIANGSSADETLAVAETALYAIRSQPPGF